MTYTHPKSSFQIVLPKNISRFVGLSLDPGWRKIISNGARRDFPLVLKAVANRQSTKKDRAEKAIQHKITWRTSISAAHARLKLYPSATSTTTKVQPSVHTRVMKMDGLYIPTASNIKMSRSMIPTKYLHGPKALEYLSLAFQKRFSELVYLATWWTRTKIKKIIHKTPSVRLYRAVSQGKVIIRMPRAAAITILRTNNLGASLTKTVCTIRGAIEVKV